MWEVLAKSIIPVGYDAPMMPQQLREHFHMPSGIYLDGNSLGLMPKAAKAALGQVLEQWQNKAVLGWEDWFNATERLSPMVANLVGAKPHEVIVTGTTTSNIHALLATFYRPVGQRRHLLATALDFPSDVYALQSWAEQANAEVRFIPSRDGHTLHPDDIAASLSDDIALALLPSVLYQSGQLLDMATITQLAQQRGVVIGWDAAHSIGCLPHHFHSIGADFAVWCHYKYLNAGPGAPAGLFVHERHHERLPALRGWWGNDKSSQFAMKHNFDPAIGAGAYQWSAPSQLHLAVLEAALAIFEQTELAQIRAHSLELTSYLMQLIDEQLPDCQIATPRQPDARGGHVALVHPQAGALSVALRQRGIIPDFRPPQTLRLAPIALYNTREELEQTVQTLRQLLDSPEQLENLQGGAVV